MLSLSHIEPSPVSLDGSLLSAMTVDDHTLYFTYDAAGAPTTVTLDGTVYYYLTNTRGDVVAILDASGNSVVTYVYDAWGNPRSLTGSLATTLGALNPLRYRGYVYDTETGLYYVSSRYYDPEIGRWINADSIDLLTATPMGLTDKNLYAYCDNNPCDKGTVLLSHTRLTQQKTTLPFGVSEAQSRY